MGKYSSNFLVNIEKSSESYCSKSKKAAAAGCVAATFIYSRKILGVSKDSLKDCHLII